ncbi:zinc metalloprotease HtpX [Ignisphaera sp. 4213-co]|uniref:Protease HtpX homolog n=1 Tax=Ignisphaera cupida TaxID=3050454 RepID=A0ABD4Z8Q0_9CREN|nr:zinc metalloprotease HtpX [Ignisphaera sp. 4213-co]MDK6028938.1 zinc metalloprotease HtpX [Ignisphaera sp. 4213-co]
MALRGKVLYVISVVAVMLLVMSIIGIIISFLYPRAALLYGLPPFYWGWLLVDLLAYIVAISTLILAGVSFERLIRSRVPAGMDHLKSSMIATGTGVIAATVLVVTAIAYLIGYEATVSIASFALAFAIFPSLISWLISPLLINLSYGCKHDPELQRIVDRVASRAGIEPPKAMIADIAVPNAFAYSSPLMGRYVAVTRGLLNTVKSEQELEAVIGHELGHHKHRDNAVMLVFGMFPSFIYYLGRFLMFAGMVSGAYRDGGSNERRNAGGAALLIIIGIVLVVVSIIIQLIVLALSRLREYYADAHGAKVTSPQAMISALQSLDRFYNTHRGALTRLEGNKIKALFIYAFAEPFMGLEEVLATHPPIHKRIAFLKTLTFTDLAEA